MKVKIECYVAEWLSNYNIEVNIWEWNGSEMFGSKGKLLSNKRFNSEEDAGEYILKMEAYYKHLVYDV